MKFTEEQRMTSFRRFKNFEMFIVESVKREIDHQAAIAQNEMDLSQDDVERFYRDKKALTELFDVWKAQWETFHKEIYETLKCQ